MDLEVKIIFIIFIVTVFTVLLNVFVAGLIHIIRETPNKQTASVFNIVLLLIAPYMIYLIVTKQGKVIDKLAIAKKDESKIEKWLKGYPDKEES